MLHLQIYLAFDQHAYQVKGLPKLNVNQTEPTCSEKSDQKTALFLLCTLKT